MCISIHYADGCRGARRAQILGSSCRKRRLHRSSSVALPAHVVASSIACEGRGGFHVVSPLKRVTAPVEMSAILGMNSAQLRLLIARSSWTEPILAQMLCFARVLGTWSDLLHRLHIFGTLASAVHGRLQRIVV